MATPEQVDVWVGLDVGKEEHYAEVLDNDGERIFARGRRADGWVGGQDSHVR